MSALPASDGPASDALASAAEEAARALRQALDSMDEGFVLVGADWRIRDMNVGTQALDGRPAAQIIGRPLFGVWPGLVGSPAEAAYRRAMARREPAKVRHHYVDERHDSWLDTRIFPSGEGLALFSRDVTMQVGAERRLREAEANAALAVQAARLGTWSYEPQSGALHWNERHRELFGVAAGAPIDYPTLIAAIHRDDRALVDAAVARGIDPRGTGELSVEYRGPPAADGSERWFGAHGRSEFEADRCVRITGVVQDITDRRLGQSLLEASEARLRAIAEAAPMIVFVTDTHGANTYTNPQFSEFSGVGPSGLLGSGWLALVHPEDRPGAAAIWAAAVAAGGTYENQFRMRRHDGVFRWFLVRAIPLGVPFGAGRPEGVGGQWLGTCTEIQELVEARQVVAREGAELERLVVERTARLAEGQQRLRALFDHSSECLFLLRVEPERGPVFFDVNPPGLAVLGHPLDAVVGLTPRELAGDGAAADDAEANMAAALRADGAPHRYIARRGYTGPSRELDAVAVALPGPGRERLILITARDVTEQRALEEALRQSQKMEAVGQLTGGIAHDFNNLLTGISGSLELMQARLAQGRLDSIDRYATAALGSVRRAAALTHRLLAFARRQALDPRPADLNRLVAGLEEMVRRTAGPAIAVEVVLAAGLWPTLCDANQLENALLNLCINARDAMPDGGRLTIESANAHLDEAYCARHADARPGQYASVAVTDTGVGMNAEVARRAFEPFFTTKPTGQGTGLGLSMLYGFVRQSEGHVRIYSEPGRGTTVRLYLPRHGGAVPPEPGEPATVLAAAGPGKTVLVVEDEAVVRMLAVDVLEGLGHTAIEAADAASALQLLQSMAPVDLLLTDVGLPGMNGRQLADAARERQPGLPVLFMTGYAHNAAVGNGRMAPGMELLSKPFALAALAAKLRAMLGE